MLTRACSLPGSSPRTRGTGAGASATSHGARFIPAHAGNRRHETGSWPDPSVHPRARGEQSAPLVMLLVLPGSSPRTRGTALHADSSGQGRRFIPAHAGNRKATKSVEPSKTVHPRARGEQRMKAAGVNKSYGSSPRTRGTGFVPAQLVGPHRFIPAHAGNRSRPMRASRAWPVHPRARGEQPAGSLVGRHFNGSSPRTRGTEPGDLLGADDRRFIPAHAGNSHRQRHFRFPASVHPRARGEQANKGRPQQIPGGSSPRTRGTASLAGGDLASRRFIPAHAGNRPPSRGH